MCGHYPMVLGEIRIGSRADRVKKECPTTKVLVALKTIGQFKIFSKE